MNNFLNNLKQSLDTGKVDQGAIDKINEINEINKLVNEKYGDEKSGKLSKKDVSKIEDKVDNIIGKKKKRVESDMLEYLDALQENVVVNSEIKIIDTMNKIMSKISEDYFFSITGLLLDEFGVKEKEIDDIVFDEVNLNDANNILSKICLLEIEYCDYLEDSVYYHNDILSIKDELLQILKNK